MQDMTRGGDMSTFLKMQKRVTELEQEKHSLQNELDRREEQFQRARARVSPPFTANTHIVENIHKIEQFCTTV